MQESLAGGKGPHFSKKQLESLKPLSAQMIDNSAYLFIYDGFVYNLAQFHPTGPIPVARIDHKEVFLNHKKNQGSTITSTDVGFHNEALAQFLFDFKNVVGILAPHTPSKNSSESTSVQYYTK